MAAGEAGADYVLFGEPDAAGAGRRRTRSPSGCSGGPNCSSRLASALRATFEEASDFAAAGADFVLVGDPIWADPRGARAALMDAEQAIRQSDAMSATAQGPQG